jgi:hypothetical protein
MNTALQSCFGCRFTVKAAADRSGKDRTDRSKSEAISGGFSAGFSAAMAV